MGVKRKRISCPKCGAETYYGVRKECWCGYPLPKIRKYEIQKWLSGILSVIVVIAAIGAWFLGLAGVWYFVWIPVIVIGGYYLYIAFQFLLAGNQVVKMAFVKRNMAIRYTVILAAVFLVIEIFRGQSIAAHFSPHHYFADRDQLLRTATKYDDNGNAYQIPVSWYDGKHQLTVYYINDANPTTWYRDSSNKWHQAHDWDAGNVHMLMIAIEAVTLILVYRKVKKIEVQLFKKDNEQIESYNTTQ